MRSGIGLAAILGLCGVSALAHAVDITRCGQPIGRGEVAVLEVDLDCSSLPGTCVADPLIACSGLVDPVCPPFSLQNPEPTRWCSHAMLTLPRDATLRLNGHAIVGDPVGAPGYPVVCDRGRCVIEGPGEIRGSTACAVSLFRATLTIRDVSIHDNGCGISANGRGTVRASNLIVSRNAGSGIEASGVLGENVVASDNGGDGLAARRVRIRGLVATNNGGNANLPLSGAGVWAQVMRVENATVTGNDGYGTGLDLISSTLPRLEGVTCGRSASLEPQLVGAPAPGAPWGVCHND